MNAQCWFYHPHDYPTEPMFHRVSQSDMALLTFKFHRSVSRALRFSRPYSTDTYISTSSTTLPFYISFYSSSPFVSEVVRGVHSFGVSSILSQYHLNLFATSDINVSKHQHTSLDVSTSYRPTPTLFSKHQHTSLDVSTWYRPTPTLTA